MPTRVRGALRRAVTTLAFAGCLAPASAASARPHGFSERRYTTADGLSQSQITSIVQDADGYLWLATGNGVDRFDGVTFRRFGDERSLPCLAFDEVDLARDGRLWTGCTGALAVQDRAGFHAVALPPGTDLGAFNAFCEAGGDVFAAIGKSIVRVGPTGTKLVALPEGARNVSIVALASTPQLGVLAGGKFGLLRIDLEHDRAEPATGPLASLAREPVLTLSTWKGDHLLVSTTSRELFEATADGVHRLIEHDRIGEIRAIARSPEGNDLWLAAAEGLVHMDASGHLEPMGASGEQVRAVALDREGDVWFSTAGVLHALTPAKFDALTRQDGLPDDFVQPILHARDGTVWFGTSKGAARLKDGHVEAFGREAGLANLTIQSLFEDARGRVVAGASPGLFAFEGGRFVPVGGAAAQDTWVYGASARADGDVWLATNTGLALFDGDRIVEKRTEGLLDRDVFSVLEDRQGRVWLSYTHHTGATVLLPDGSVRQLDAQAGGRPASVASTFIDSRGRVWMPSDRGLLRMDVDPPRAFGVREGMPDDNLYMVLEDASGDLWVSGDGGIVRFDGEKVLARYTTSDGLAANEHNSGAAAKDAAGKLWFGSTGGVTIVDPARIPKNEVAPRALVEEVRFGDRAFSALSLPSTVGPGDNNVRFDFTATALRAPRAVRIDTMLEGFDRAWTTLDLPAAQRRAVYTNLPPGSYTFRVRAANEDGVWSEAPAVVRFRVVPAWWRTWWAWTSYAAGLVGIGALTARSRAGALRRQAAALETKVKERTNELDAKVGELAHRNDELSRLNAELVASNQRADRIFSALAEALPGTVLDGKYKLGERIGSGGFGAVFRAKQLDLRRDVAVKVFRPAPGNDTADALERFRREAIAACRVRHANAVSVYDSGISKEGIAYLVMELLHGESLAALLKGGPLSLARCVEILVPACAALQAAHDAGIVHRDMKPDNVVLHRDADGTEVVKVVDFGLARLTENEAATQAVGLTRADVLIGTPAFIAPERLRGQPHDGRADVFSLAVMAYLMICGRLPFETEDDPTSYGARVLRGDAVLLRARVASVPLEVEALILRGLAVNPQLRPTAGELGRTLASIATGVDEAVRSKPLPPLTPRAAGDSIANVATSAAAGAITPDRRQVSE